MTKRIVGAMLMVVGVLAVSGCATTSRSSQADLDALNSKVSTLEGQLSAKDGELSRLQSQVNDQRTALAQAEADKRVMGDKLDQALAQLSVAKERKAQPAPAPKQETSDLK